jgi:epoxyqueuosine reductase
VTTPDYIELAGDIKAWGIELGFQQVGISATQLGEDETHLLNWLAAGRHGAMDYMQRHGLKRSRPADLQAGTLRVISVRMDYDPPAARDAWEVIDDAELGYVSRYALGRDYHKVLRSRLQKLADRVTAHIGPFGYRAFVDSAPVLEKALARNAGLGWIGNTPTSSTLVPVPGSSSANSTPTCRCRWMRRRRNIAALACAAWKFVRPRRSLHLISSMRGAASPI